MCCLRMTTHLLTASFNNIKKYIFLSFTAPRTPSANIHQINTTAVTINIEMIQDQAYFYTLYLVEEDIKNGTIYNSEFTIEPLIPGKEYEIHIYASYEGWTCDKAKEISTYTGIQF